MKNYSRVLAATVAGVCTLGLTVLPAYAAETTPLPAPATSAETKPSDPLPAPSPQTKPQTPAPKPENPTPAPAPEPETKPENPAPKPETSTPVKPSETTPTTKPSEHSVHEQTVTDRVTPAPQTASTVRSTPTSQPIRRSYAPAHSQYRGAARSSAATTSRLAETGSSVLPVTVASLAILMAGLAAFVMSRKIAR